MKLLGKSILTPTLGLILALTAWAGDDDKKSSDKKGDEQTIRGVISEVTVLGETDIDFKTRKAITAEETFVTIIGHPSNHNAMHKEGGVASADKNKDVKRTSTDTSKAGERPRHRMNVYVVAISPKTKVCESKESGKDGSASGKEEACDLDKLEIGDRVEVSFNPKMMPASSENKGEAKASTPSKHGRHRVYFGNATAIKIMTEPMEGEHSASSSSDKK